MKVVVLPIEPLVERYSAQWLEWTKAFFRVQSCLNTGTNIPNVFLLPDASYAAIKDGQFLDVIGTNIYKARQLEMAMEWIAKQDRKSLMREDLVFWIHDGWFPGIESLAYVRDAMGYKFKIVACLHAGTWDDYDFLTFRGMSAWAENLEKSWMQVYDRVFVATDFHKNLLVQKGRVQADKVAVTGFPFFMPDGLAPFETDAESKEDIIVFPHRLAPEKQDYLFDLMAEEIKKYPQLRHFRCIKTKEATVGMSTKIAKAHYYELLARAKYSVSFALQETWGIAMQESVAAGCIPIVPDRLSYSEMYPDLFKINCINHSGEASAAAASLALLEEMPASAYASLRECKARIFTAGKYAIPNMLSSIKTNQCPSGPYTGGNRNDSMRS